MSFRKVLKREVLVVRSDLLTHSPHREDPDVSFKELIYSMICRVRAVSFKLPFEACHLDLKKISNTAIFFCMIELS